MNAYGLKKYLQLISKIFFFFLIILVPIVMIGRVHHRWDETKQVPDELLYHAEQINSYIPKRNGLGLWRQIALIYLYYLNRKGVVINKLNQKSINKYKKASLIILWANSMNMK